MNDLTLNTENATAVDTATVAVVVTPADRLMAASKAVNRSLAKVFALDGQLADQTIALSTTKQRVTEALANGGTGFDDASRAFKQANNKLDKLLESREVLVLAMQDELDAVRDATADVAALLRSLES